MLLFVEAFLTYLGVANSIDNRRHCELRFKIEVRIQLVANSVSSGERGFYLEGICDDSHRGTWGSGERDTPETAWKVIKVTYSRKSQASYTGQSERICSRDGISGEGKSQCTAQHW